MLLSFLRKHVLAAALFAAALGGLGWFATGFVQEALYFSDPAHKEQDLALWMSPRYVAKSWDLPREVIIQTMDLQPDHAQPTLREVIAHLGISLPELQARIEAAKARLEAARGAHHGGKHD